MRTTLQIDDDVLESARVLADAERRTIGAVISELARRSLRPTPLRRGGDFPVFDVPAGAGPISSDDVTRALAEE